MGAVPLVVLDTSVLVSAFGWKGSERSVYRLCRKDELQMVTSAALLAEFERVLGYPKFDLERSEIEAVLADVRSTALLVEPDQNVRAVPDDPADDRVLECALEAGADWIASGDRHLLDLECFDSTPIVRAPELLERIVGQESSGRG